MDRFISAVSTAAPLSNALLQIGSDEYNKVRYPYDMRYGRSMPMWKSKMLSQIRGIQSRIGTGYQGRPSHIPGVPSGSHALHNIFLDDLRNCISNNINFKTKTFEYNALTGHVFVSGKYVGTYDSKRGCLSSFTLKYINDKLSRYRLRDFGILIVKKKDGYYLKVLGSKRYVDLVSIIYGDLSNLSNALQPEFENVKIEQFESYTCFYLKLRENVEYRVDAMTNQSYGIHSLNRASNPEFVNYAFFNCSALHHKVLSGNFNSMVNKYEQEYADFKDWIDSKIKPIVFESDDVNVIAERFCNFLVPYLENKFSAFHMTDGPYILLSGDQSLVRAKKAYLHAHKGEVAIITKGDMRRFPLPVNLKNPFHRSEFVRYKFKTPDHVDAFHCLSEKRISVLRLKADNGDDLQFTNLAPHKSEVRPVLHSLLGKEALILY